MVIDSFGQRRSQVEGGRGYQYTNTLGIRIGDEAGKSSVRLMLIAYRLARVHTLNDGHRFVDCDTLGQPQLKRCLLAW